MKKARVIYEPDVQALVATRAWRYPRMCLALKFSALGSCKRLQRSAGFDRRAVPYLKYAERRFRLARMEGKWIGADSYRTSL
jgi:hypothetical protein